MLTRSPIHARGGLHATCMDLDIRPGTRMSKAEQAMSDFVSRARELQKQRDSAYEKADKVRTESSSSPPSSSIAAYTIR